MYDLGIVGGMGSKATVEIFDRIIAMTEATNDSEHMKIIILNNSNIPDRTDNILYGDKSPINEINETINDIRKIGARNIIIACNTAHYYVDDLDFSGMNFISIVDTALKCLFNNYKNKKIIILGTRGIIKTNIFLNNIYSKNLDLNYLDYKKQKLLQEIIYQIKSGINPLTLLDKFIDLLEDKDSIYLLACTELSLFKNCLANYILVDSMDCLVKEVIIKAGYKLRDVFK